jgi:Trypsin-like peptidase domain
VAIAGVFALLVVSCSSDTPTVTEINTLATEATTTAQPTTTSIKPEDSWADVVERVRPAVVRIEIDTCTNESGVGSGFAIDGWVMTNRHVVEGYRNLVVVNADGTKRLPEQVRVSTSLDLALIKIPLDLSMTWTTKVPRVADEVAALGFPRGIGFSFTKGSISALDVRVDDVDFSVTGLLQTDAAVNPGNSGGPLIDKDGNVLGVVVLKRNDSEGLAFAIDGRQAQVFMSGQKGEPYSPCEETSNATPNETIGGDSEEPQVPEAGGAGAPTPEAVVIAFYDAVRVGDFDLAWQLGGKNLGKNPKFDVFAAGYDSTESSEVEIVDVDGNQVTVRVTAVEQTNQGQQVSTYLGTYTVNGEEITNGKLKLIGRE